MKAIKEEVLYQSGSFSAYLYEGKSFDHPYHFHIEYEIVLVDKGSGKLLMNEQVCEFEDGDIFIFNKRTGKFTLFEDWKQKPFAQRVKMLCIAWATQGYGSPASVYVFYLLKIAFYVWGWF